jgi:prepilin-type N-terminal cleavage/methylation domain-containing protein
MKRRSGFTLMELLLVVAILAIVAAAAAPTFFGGATEAIAEAKKAAYLSACSSALSGGSIYASIESSKGNTPAALIPIATYSPLAARTFKNTKGVSYVIGAKWNDTTKAVELFCTKGDTDASTAGTTIDIEANWTAIRDVAS